MIPVSKVFKLTRYINESLRESVEYVKTTTIGAHPKVPTFLHMNVIHPPIDFHIGLRLCPVVYIPPFKSFIRHKPQPAKRVNTENTEPVVKTLNHPERLSAIVILLKNLYRVESADYQITARCQEYISDEC